MSLHLKTKHSKPLSGDTLISKSYDDDNYLESAPIQSTSDFSASGSLEDALGKLGVVTDSDEETSKPLGSVEHSSNSEAHRPGNKQAKKPNVSGRVRSKKQSIEHEFELRGMKRSELVPDPSRKFLKVRHFDLEFETLKPLGTGTFGKVSLVRHVSTRQLMAVKKVSKALVVRFHQEARIMNERNYLRALNSPFIVKFYGSYSDATNLFFFLEYLPGGELFTRIQKGHGGRKGLKAHHARLYLAEVLLAFEHLHRFHIVYRDLKPENLLIDAEGHIRLVDLGFALQIAYKSWSICGTTEYMAPEMVQGRGSGYGADWWALGILLYEMLVGRTPFRAADKMACYKRIIQDEVLFPPDFPSRSAKMLIRQLLAKDVSMRLGCTAQGVEAIKSHAFFFEFDWKKCANKQLRTPWVPKFKNATDTRNFLTEGQDFTESSLTLSDVGVTDKELAIFDDF